jgi:hypothetical protein
MLFGKGRNLMSRLKISIMLAIVMLTLMMAWPSRVHAQIGTVIPTPSPVATPSPTPQPYTVNRTFHCNCYTPGQPVIWAGNVQATSYFQARQMAESSCSGYLGEKPISPLIPTPVQTTGIAQTFIPLAINVCGQCACN